MANELNLDIGVSKFELQSHYFVHFELINLEKD